MDVHFIKNISSDDIDLFFGPLDSTEQFIEIEDHWIMAHLLHKVGIFKSISQARKNGWDKPIPNGFSEFTVGKKRRRFWILNIGD